MIQPIRAGLFEANLSLALADLPDQPIDLRLYNERPAFGGHVTLVKVTLTPRPRAADEPL